MTADGSQNRPELRVVTGRCPVFGGRTYALWDGDGPVVPATVFLRFLGEDAGWTANTGRVRAYGLLHFWRWMRSSEPPVEFWDLTLPRLRQYKAALTQAVQAPKVIPTADGPPWVQRNPACLKIATANAYLEAVRRLFDYWAGLIDAEGTPGRPIKARGTFAHLYVRPKRFSRVFRIKVRRGRRTSPLAIPGPLLTRIFAYLDERHALAQARPAVLATQPETPTEYRLWRRAERRWERAKMLAYRDKAVFAFMLMTGVRIGELCRTREDDLLAAGGLLHIVDRPEDADLGDLKTGPGDVVFGRTNPLLVYLDQWDMYGVPLADKRRAARQRAGAAVDGRPMLFRNSGGGPLTQDAVRRLLRRIARDCGVLSEVERFSPHITRHTASDLMIQAKIPLTVVQAFLRHQSISSTEVYARLHDGTARTALEAFWAGLGELLPSVPARTS